MKKIAKLRAIYSSIAGVLCVALVGTTIHFTSEQAHAKETFQGISDIVMDNSSAKPFGVLEVVPGTASYVVTGYDGMTPVTLDLSLGEMGYLIDGAEPIDLANQLKKLPGAQQRKEFVEAYIKADEKGQVTGGALASITSDTKDNTKPLYYVPYEEAYNVSENAIAQAEEEGNPWNILEADDPNAEQEISGKHMSVSGNTMYLKNFSPKYNGEKTVESVKSYIRSMYEMLADLMDSGTDSNMKMESESFTVTYTASGNSARGDFDPAVHPDFENGTYRVIFERNNAQFGYQVDEAKEVHQGEYSKEKPETDVYEKFIAGGKEYYVYAGKYNALYSKLSPAVDTPATGGVVGAEEEVVHEDGSVDEPVRDDEGAEVSGVEEEMMPDMVEIAPEEDNSGILDSGNDSERVYDDESNNSSDEDSNTNNDNDSENNNQEEDKKSEESHSDDEKKSDEDSSEEKKSDDSEKSEESHDDSNDSAKAVNANRPSAAHDVEAEVSVKDQMSEFMDSISVEDEIETEEMDELESVEEAVSQVEEEVYEYVAGDEDALYEESNVEEQSEAIAADETAPIQGETTGKYYVVSFKYSTSPVPAGEVCYSVKSFQHAESTNALTYALDMDDETMKESSLYVRPNYAGTGLLNGKGQEDFLYTYIEPTKDAEGNVEYYRGNYKLEDVYSDEVYRVKNVTIFYRGGFKNMNYFTQHIFDRDVDLNLDPVKEIFYNYATITPTHLSSDVQIGNVGLVYISAGKGAMLPAGAEINAAYGPENDITVSCMMDILGEVVNNDLPVMIDSAIFTDKSLEGTNLHKLCQLLLQDDISTWYNENYLKAEEVLIGVPAATDYFSEEPLYHHVNKSVYVYDYSAHPDTMIHADLNLASAEYLKGGFDEIRDQIADENKYREVDAGSSSAFNGIPTTVTEAVAIKYIISYRGRRSAYVKESIKVLELQPGAIPMSKSDKKEGNLYVEEVQNSDDDEDVRYNLCRKSYEGGNQNDTIILKELPNEITLVSMSISELVGHYQDLNSEYDLIYIGLSNANFNVDGKGRTVYNDSSMNGLLYTNVGDKIRISGKVMGALTDEQGDMRQVAYENLGESNNIGVFRGSGSDFTKYALNQMKEYVNGGYPVLVDYNCFFADTDMVYDGPLSGKYDNDDRGYIDNCSRMYEFLDYCEDEYGINESNFFRLNKAGGISQAVQSRFEWYLNLPKPEIALDTSVTQVDTYTTAYFDGGEYFMDYRFEIKDKRSTDEDDTYNVKLYIDDNGDGKYSTDEERTDFSLSGTSGGVDKSEGKYRLKIGKTYKLRYQCEDELNGPKAWKLVVTINSRQGMDSRIANARRDEIIGVYFIDRTGEPEPINVLQITADESFSGGWPKIDEGGNAADGGMKGAFDKVADKYTITCDTMKTSEFIEAVAMNPNYIFENEYNVVILGFQRNYTGFDDLSTINNLPDWLGTEAEKLEAARSAADIVLAYMEEGNSAIVGPGVVGHTYYPDLARLKGFASDKGIDVWGYNMTRRFRAIVGMDRYGVTQLTDVGMTNNNLGAKINNVGSSKNRTVTGEIKDANKYGVAYAYIPNSRSEDSDSKKLAREVQGYNNFFISFCRAASAGSYIDHYVGCEDKNHETNYNDTSLMSGEMASKKLNEGVITLYPNNLDAAIKSSNQGDLPYNSLDLEGDYDLDGMPDVTVWFSYGAGKKDIEAQRNNAKDLYYLATKRNISYFNLSEAPHTVEQMDLFVNVLVATYLAGPNKPQVHIVDKPSPKAMDIDVIYVPYEDINDTESIIGSVQDVYFHSTKGNKTADMISRFYVVDEVNGTITKNEDGSYNEEETKVIDGVTYVPRDIAGKRYYVHEITDDVVIHEGSTEAKAVPDKYTLTYRTRVKNEATGKFETVEADPIVGYVTLEDVAYDIEVPLTYLDTKSEISVIVETISYVKDSTRTVPQYATDKVKLVKTELFTLD